MLKIYIIGEESCVLFLKLSFITLNSICNRFFFLFRITSFILTVTRGVSVLLSTSTGTRSFSFAKNALQALSMLQNLYWLRHIGLPPRPKERIVIGCTHFDNCDKAYNFH